MKWRKYKKRVKKLCGKNNAKFHIDHSDPLKHRYYMATRINEKLTFVSNYWMELEF